MTDAPPGSLLSLLAEIPDPRSRHGRRHPLVGDAHSRLPRHPRAAAAATPPSSSGVATSRSSSCTGFGYRRRPASCGTFQALFARLPADAPEAALARWADHLPGPRAGQARRPVAIDGKVPRGGGTADSPALHLHLHLLPAPDHRTGCVPAQARVPAETDEHEAALVLLKARVREGRVITGDAAFCRRDLGRQVVDDGGHSRIKVDDYPPTPRADIATAFGPSSSPLRAAEGGRAVRPGDYPGQARRAGRAAAVAGHDDAQRLPRLAGPGTGRAAGANGRRRRGGGRRGAGPGHPRAAVAGRRGDAAGPDPGAPGDRGPVALRPRRDEG